MNKKDKKARKFVFPLMIYPYPDTELCPNRKPAATSETRSPVNDFKSEGKISFIL